MLVAQRNVSEVSCGIPQTLQTAKHTAESINKTIFPFHFTVACLTYNTYVGVRSPSFSKNSQIYNGPENVPAKYHQHYVEPHTFCNCKLLHPHFSNLVCILGCPHNSSMKESIDHRLCVHTRACISDLETCEVFQQYSTVL